MHKHITGRAKIKLCARLSGYDPKAMPCMAEYYLDDSMTLDNGILGKFILPNRIHLPASAEWELMNGNLYDPTICHELVHLAQYRKQGVIIYALRNLTRINEFAANKEEMRVRRIMGLEAFETGED